MKEELYHNSGPCWSVCLSTSLWQDLQGKNRNMALIPKGLDRLRIWTLVTCPSGFSWINWILFFLEAWAINIMKVNVSDASVGPVHSPRLRGTWPQQLSVAQLILQTGSFTLTFALNLSCWNLKCFSSYPVPSDYEEQTAACSGVCTPPTAKLLGDPGEQDLVNLSMDFI